MQSAGIVIIRVCVLSVICTMLLSTAWKTSPPVSALPQPGAITQPEPNRQLPLIPIATDPVPGDLQAIHSRGVLRVLVQKQQDNISISPPERLLVQQYAEEQNVTPEWLSVEHDWQLALYLQQGKGDLAVAVRKPVTDKSLDNIKYTLPWSISRQHVIGRVDTGRIKSVKDLATRQLALKRSSRSWRSMELLAEQNKGMDLVAIPENQDDTETLARVESGQYDITIMDSIALEAYLPQFLDLQVLFDLTGDEAIKWGTHPAAITLHKSLNQFLKKKHLERAVAKKYREDLPALQKRKLIRLITYQSPVNYFLDHGKLKGFEYELIYRFAMNHNMRVDVIIANSYKQMQKLLLGGEGDLIAASLPKNGFTKNERINYTNPYNFAAPVVIGRKYDSDIIDANDLAGRSLALPIDSPYRSYIEKYRAAGIAINIIDLKPGLDAETVMFRVAQGIYDLTILSGHELKSQLARQMNLKAHFAMAEPLPLAWVVRREDTQLLDALNEYIKTEYRKGFYNVVYAKYIDNPGAYKGNSQLLAQNNNLSPYDEIVHKYAERYGFDWRLIVAQMYQESRFNPEAVSYAGAEGLMQLIPATAELMGITEPSNPDKSINAGVRYLGYLRDRIDHDLLLEDRTWFALAAYNAGFNRLQKARLLAEKMNLNKDKWFDNVEKAMLALARPYQKNGEFVRYCRCGQTVNYVREIKTLYNNYVRLTESIRTAAVVLQSEQEI